MPGKRRDSDDRRIPRPMLPWQPRAANRESNVIVTQSLLTINAGSSSVKFALFAIRAGALGERLAHGEIAGIGTRAAFEAYDADDRPMAAPDEPERIVRHDDALAAMFAWLDRHPAAANIVAVGHRIVHGGSGFSDAVRIDVSVLDALEALVPMARLHQPFELAAVRAVRERAPALCQVACFDTAFHRSQPELAQIYPLPRALTQSGIRRYGFHGLSYAYIAEQLARELPGFDRARVIVAHLGSGASLCALQGGRSVATTMGFTALDGLMMGTRAGSIDPGIVLYLLQERGMSAAEASRLLHHECGLRGVSGTTGDMRALLASDDPCEREAVDLFVYVLVKEIGAMAACLGGLDALVFTAGIGERAAPIRARACEQLAWMGVMLDRKANDANARRIDAAGSRVSAWVIPTDEAMMIARDTLRIAQVQPS